jgi:3-oxoacyl-[acyl-carrier protein] reductase
MVESAVEELGRLDYLINNAGTAATDSPIPRDDLDALTDERWHEILNVNLVGPYRCTRAAAKYLKQTKGAVVNTASVAAFGTGGSTAIYAASKAGLVNLTMNLAVGLSPEVRVNAVAPGYITTPWSQKFGSKWEENAVQASALKRAGRAEEVADAMLFLCAGATYISGQTIVIDGGTF